MKLIFARHGQTFNNAEGIVNGMLDDKTAYLSQAGVDEAIRLASFAERHKVGFIYSSPLHRAMQTAKHVSDKIGLSIKEDKRLVECNFGKWEGKKMSEVDRDEIKKRERERYGYVYPGEFNGKKAESYKGMFSRVKMFIEEILKKHKKNDVALIVSHTGVILNVWKYFEKWDDDVLTSKQVSNHHAYIVDTETGVSEEVPY